MIRSRIGVSDPHELLASLEAELYPSIGGWRGLYPAPFAARDADRP